MRMIPRPPLLLCLVATLAAVASTGCSGCDDTCDPSFDPGCAGVTVPDAAAPSCVPSESARPVDEQCGTFVSISRRPTDPKEESLPGDGSKQAPFTKFSEAIAQARKDK